MNNTEKVFAARLLAIAGQLDGSHLFNLPGEGGRQMFNPEAIKLYWNYVSKRLNPEQIEQAFDRALDEDEFPRAKAFVQLVLGSPQLIRDAADKEWMEVTQAIDEAGYRPKLSRAGLRALTSVGGLYAIRELAPSKRSTVFWNFRDLYQAAVHTVPGCNAITPDRVPCLPGSGGISPDRMIAAAPGEERGLALYAFALNHAQAVTDIARAIILADAEQHGFAKQEVVSGQFMDAPEVGSKEAAEAVRKIAELVAGLARSKAAQRPKQAEVIEESTAVEHQVLFQTKRDRWRSLAEFPSFAEERDRLFREIKSMADGSWIHPTVVVEIESWLEDVTPAPDRSIDEALEARIHQEMQALEVDYAYLR